MNTKATIRILVIDDSESMRHTLQQCFEAFDDLEWVGESSDDQDALIQCERLHPDVVLMDVALPRTDVAQLIHRIHEIRPEIQVIGTISFEEQATIDVVMKAGAALCLSKYTPVLRIAELVRQVGQSVGSRL
jgi:DNA-binding NarL/FixJ family response regulator